MAIFYRTTSTARNTAILLAVVLASPVIAQHYNLASDFNLAQNPSVPWSYRIDGSPIACQISGSAIGYIPELQGWCCNNWFDASITKIIGTPTNGVWFDAMLNDVVIHVSSTPFPGPMSIRWTAPTAGIISISGSAWDASFNTDRDAGWVLSLNGITLASHGTIYGIHRGDVAALFESNVVAGHNLGSLVITAGDAITFSTYAKTYYGHFMGIDIGIDLTCRADFNHDGFVTGDDFDAFSDAFVAGLPTSDFDGNGFITGDDFDGYIAVFAAGC